MHRRSVHPWIFDGQGDRPATTDYADPHHGWDSALSPSDRQELLDFAPSTDRESSY
jgi:hypothetical protein